MNLKRKPKPLNKTCSSVTLASFFISKYSLYPNAFTDSTYSIHYYDGIVIIEKRKRDTRYNDICQQAIIGKTKE